MSNGKYTTQNQTNWANFETLKEYMGAEALLNELMQAMSARECAENLEFIARMHDISILTKGDA